MKKAFLPIAFTLPILLSACGGENAQTDIDQASEEYVVGKSLRMSLDLGQLQAVGIASDKVVVTITKGEFSQTLEISHTDYSATAEFSNLALGDYQVDVQIFDGETVVAEGVGTGTVSINQLASVDLKLELMSGGLAINVCIADTTMEGYSSHSFNMAITEQVELIGLAAGFFGEVVAGGAPEYGSTLEYAQLAVDENLQITLGLLDSFVTVDEVTKVIEADENTLIIRHNGEDIFSAAGCDQKLTLKIVDVASGGVLTGATEKRIQLVADILVDEQDYIMTNGEVVDINGGISENPYYRQINKVTATITFQPVEGGIESLTAFENADVSELFSTANFTHSLDLQSHTVEADFAFLSITLGGIELPAAEVGPLRAVSESVQ